MIHAAVEATIGFSNLNALLIKHLRNWLVEESTAALDVVKGFAALSGGVADTSSNDGWAGQPSAGDWSSPGGSSDDWASPGNQSTDEDRWYQPPPK